MDLPRWPNSARNYVKWRIYRRLAASTRRLAVSAGRGVTPNGGEGLQTQRPSLEACGGAGERLIDGSIVGRLAFVRLLLPQRLAAGFFRELYVLLHDIAKPSTAGGGLASTVTRAARPLYLTSTGRTVVTDETARWYQPTERMRAVDGWSDN